MTKVKQEDRRDRPVGLRLHRDTHLDFAPARALAPRSMDPPPPPPPQWAPRAWSPSPPARSNAGSAADATKIANQRDVINRLQEQIQKLQDELSSKGKTIANQRNSNSDTLKSLGKARKEINVLKEQLEHIPKQGVSKKKHVDASSELNRLRQEVATLQMKHHLTVAGLEQRQRDMQDRAEESEAALVISKAKLPELLDKASHSDRLIDTLFARDATIKTLDTMLEQATLERSSQPQLIKAALYGQAAQHDLIVQGYAGQIRKLEAQMEEQKHEMQAEITHNRGVIDDLSRQLQAADAQVAAEEQVIAALKLELEAAQATAQRAKSIASEQQVHVERVMAANQRLQR